ncbi:hybrid sensor histidine kinase/response regulator [bacterium]|nr:MAG: hybrid sensor histidine kinase/response regulator [bacterium]
MDKSLSILLVEDSDDDAALILRALSRGNFGIRHECVSSENALREALARKNWDVVLSDYYMPGFGGLQAIRIVQEASPDTPVIIVSGAIGEETAVELMRSGAHDFINKDKLMRLLPALERELAESQVRREREEAQESLRQELSLNAVLAELARKLISVSDDLESMAQMVLDKAKELTGSSHGYVAVVEPRTGNIRPVTYSEMMRTPHKEGDGGRGFSFSVNPDGSYRGLWGYSLNTRTSHFENYPQSHGSALGIPRGHEPIEKFMAVPVLYQGELVGQIALANPGRDYNGQDVVKISSIADLLSLSIVRQQNIHEREELESQLRQSQKMEAIGTLAGGIAHDFNNILTPLIGYAELVKTNLRDDPVLLRQQDEVLKACVRARELVQQILTFSRQSEEERKPLLVQSIVKEALRLLRSAIPSTIEMELDLAGECGAVLADSSQIHQVVMNLCTNAFYAMRENGGTLTVSLHEKFMAKRAARLDLRPGRYVELVVADTGHGIGQGTIEKIFDPYFTTKKKGEGTGLGLAIALGIVKKCGGTITAVSEEGQGTSFFVYLPVIEAKMLSESEKSPEARMPVGSEHILVIDDDRTIMELEQEMLCHLGYRVTGFSNCLDALDTFSASPGDFDLVITDLIMPNFSGTDLAQKVTAIRPEMPVMLCTGLSEDLSPSCAAELGIRRIVIKPIILKEFALAVRSVLDVASGKK